MKKLLASLTKIENVLMIVAFVIMVGCVFFQVVNRNFLKLPMAWLDEAATYSMIYMALIGTEVGLRDGSQIAVTAVVDKLNGRGREIVQILAKVVVLIFSGSVLYSSILMVGKQIATGQTSAAMRIPMAIPYAALVIAFAMIVLVQLYETIYMLKDLISGKSYQRYHDTIAAAAVSQDSAALDEAGIPNGNPEGSDLPDLEDKKS